ncbi:superfamily II DNA or RNA helicase [Nocardioides cavernae]|uniref:Superfamily II DNA or RNA helicase n=1 Tax=Nocardioides cavernae TaxID=1921566 RepID=A0A7Y9H4E8_9ACTN|nr:DEAD/DEAH box helicase [Nocardioides cavernae]NYE37732.1 superfamily II DNA or RNA helicase [Nocardioides cavernae]
MDIRDALTATYLARFFDLGTLLRARDYVGVVSDLAIVHETTGSLSVTASVPGSAAVPYRVQLHAEVDETDDWLFSSCTCPVSRMCKHGAAVALRLRGPARTVEPGEPVWRRQLDRFGDEVAARARATLSGQRLGLELVLRPPTRWSRGEAGEITMRPVRPGARRGWARSGAEWGDLAGPVALTRFVPAQVEALRVLHRGLVSRHTYLVAGAAPALDDYGDRLVPALRAAVAAGVTLVPGAGVASVDLADEPAAVVADLREVDGRPTLELSVDAGGRRWRGHAVVPVGQPATSVVLVDGDDLVLADLAEPCPDSVMDLVLGRPVVAPAEDRDDFVDALGPLARRVRLESSDASMALPAPLRPVLHLTVTWRSATHAELTWAWAYGDHRCGLTDADVLAGLRDPVAEQDVLARVPSGLLATSAATGGDALALALHDLPHLRTLDDVAVDEVEPPEFRESESAPLVTFTLAEAQPDHTDWLDLEVLVRVDGEAVPLPEVLAAVTRGEDYLVLPSGTYVALARPEFTRLHDAVALAAQLRDAREDRISVGTADLGVWAELAEVGVVDDRAAAWVERATALRDLADVPRPEPVGLATSLRPYQLEGFWWLAFLHQHRLGGILADDMGLGKTLQVLALVQHARAEGSTGPFLIVAPTSVVSAWRSQAATHAPGLRVGVVRRRSDDVAAIALGHDVVVTTYSVLRLEREQFAARHWGGLVLDEAQQVKNHQSKTYAAARVVEADVRLAVTGTPFENRLMELWTLLSLTAPGLYPTSRRFREVVVVPVEKEGDDAALDRFRARIRPFVLRRTKDLVAADLPPRQEQVLDVDLTPRHRRIYDTHLARERQKILGLVEDFGRNRVAIFSALTRLRQLALDPALVDAGHAEVGSAKTDLLAEHLVEITAEGHRALVFSTFTTFLRRVRDRLTDEGVATVYLDGGTRDRDAVIEAFRSGEAPVFLISLKAGGTGLTLTEADYVFLLDPWWNPAAEAQAVDRAHRIGQTKPVHVYRLVASDTIEEKVMALKARKAELFAKVVDGGGASATGITADDIRGLFDG